MSAIIAGMTEEPLFPAELPSPPADKSSDAKTPKRRSWRALSNHARIAGQISGLLVVLLGIGFAGGFYFLKLNTPAPTTSTPTTVTSLSAEDLAKLSQSSASLGSSGQTLNIGADALFRGKADVTGNLTVGGNLVANGPVSLSALSLTGSGGLSVTGPTNLASTTTISRSLSVSELITASGLNVSGTTSTNTLNATSITVRNLLISGPLTVGHIVTQGVAPSISAAAVGAGGTVSISGNDTAGTVNVNTGTGPGNTLATITFRGAYGSAPRVILTPLTDAAAAAGAYITRSATGFQLRIRTPVNGVVLSYDYIVVQ